jgi:hypothetical protein
VRYVGERANDRVSRGQRGGHDRRLIDRQCCNNTQKLDFADRWSQRYNRWPADAITPSSLRAFTIRWTLDLSSYRPQLPCIARRKLRDTPSSYNPPSSQTHHIQEVDLNPRPLSMSLAVCRMSTHPYRPGVVSKITGSGN